MIARYMPYTLSLRAPAVLTSLGGDSNSSRTLPFIPGAALRGAAARGLGDPGGDADRLRSFRTLILDGTVRFLNAYPRVGGRRTVPTPVPWRIDKSGTVGPGGEITAWDLAAFDGDPRPDDAAWPDASLSAMPECFVSIGAAQPLRVALALGSRIHQQRDRSRGRAWKEERQGREEAHGAIFAFEFLEAGQELAGLIQIRGKDSAACDALLATIQDALRGPVLLGRSRRGGYGGDATISWGAACDRELTGQGVVHADLPDDTCFRALLTSPYVGRDPDTGQIDSSHVTTEIMEAFAGRVEVIRRRWGFERVGGFNRKWRIELPQVLACAAGSVLVLRTTTPIPFADLLAVEHAGIGERRVEGFGRVLYLEAPAPTLVLRRPSPTAPQAPIGDPPEVVRFAEARILDSAVARAIDQEAARLARSAKSSPAPALLGRLRNVMQAAPETALETLRTWLSQQGRARLKRPAMDQIERCRIGESQRLASWLRAMAGGQDSHGLETLLRFDALAQRFHIHTEASAREHLLARVPSIRARLIDSTLAALARKHRQRRSS